MSIDAAVGGALKNKPYPDACALIKDMAQNHYQWESERAQVEKRDTIGGIHEVNCMDMIRAKMDALALKVEHMSANPITAIAVDCEICGTKGHLAPECNLLTESNSDQVNYAQGNPFSNTYYHGWRNLPNFSYKNNNPIQSSTPQRSPCFQSQIPIQPMQVVPQKPNLEKIMENFISAQTQQNKEFLNEDIPVNELITQLGTKVDSIITHNKMLETQISQIAQQVPQATPGGQFLGQPQPNPREQANVVTLQSGTTYDEPVKPTLSGSEASKKNFVSRDEVIEKIHVKIPFTEATTQIPSYAKFLKYILTNKCRLDDPKPLECNSIVENKLSKKEKDPGSFSIPCILGNNVIDNAFLDLEASISLMPLVVCRRLNLGELKPTKMPLQLADKSVKYPIGILEYIPVRNGQLYIPTDFVVMDIKEDNEIPILLGRPFLSTTGAIIDVKRGKLTFEVGDEKIKFILSKFLMAPVIEDSCYAIDIIDECIRELD
ncbi:uncharacterized protein LOC127081527 [Lathyrus oleraceus]|uniref:uncharacterized protein LOC127081527 n=1 Tax=Pisum sativum TaxID=3888 RepID=UPI0021D35938|nr:uncharacterized protein LOC127081527 [Pisum sativum]